MSDVGPIDISQSLCDDVIGRQLPSWLQNVLDDVAAQAFTICPVGTPDPLGRPRAFNTPLRYTINTKITGSGVGVIGLVQANSPYAKFVHDGTAAHPIQPIGTGYPLRFMKDGTVRYPWKVNHPGTSAQPFLRDALVSVVGGTLTFAAAA